MLMAIVLIAVLLICLITDIKNRKILNIVTLPAILFGIVFYTLTEGISGLLFSGLGFLVGLGVLLIPYLMGGMGAGDVKLMAAIGALTGVSFTFYTFIYAALIGGLVAIFLLIKNAIKGMKGQSVKSLVYSFPLLKSNLGSMILGKGNKSNLSFPYGVAIVLGSVLTTIGRQWL